MTDDTTALASGLLSGEPSATHEVRERVRRILAFRGYGIPPEDRRDLEQIVLVQIWEAVGKPGFEPAKLWGLVEVMAARRCVDWLRRRRATTVELTEMLPDTTPRPDDTAIAHQRRELARHALGSLPAPCRRLIELHVGHGLSYREISRILGKSEGALRVQMTRCIQRAAEKLQETEQIDERVPDSV